MMIMLRICYLSRNVLLANNSVVELIANFQVIQYYIRAGETRGRLGSVVVYNSNGLNDIFRTHKHTQPFNLRILLITHCKGQTSKMDYLLLPNNAIESP